MTSTFEDQLFKLASKYKTHGILLDTNVLLLYLFATYDPSKVGIKRLAKYGKDDGQLLISYIGRFSHILTTSHVLAETSNLVRQIVSGQVRTELSTKFHPLFCSNLPNSFRQCAVDVGLIKKDLFGQLGLTDSGLTTLVQSKQLLLTDDLDLFRASMLCGGDAINFTHMREAAGFL